MLPCRYAEYETKLEALRAHRKELMGLQGKTTLADYAIVKRIHLIYERATRKFRGDLRVWLKWLHFCRTSGSTRQISRVYPPCIPVGKTDIAFLHMRFDPSSCFRLVFTS